MFDHSLLIFWALALSAIASCNLLLWGRYLVEHNWSHINCFISNLLVFNLALADSGLMPNRLELELTESSIMHDSPRVLNMLSAFRKIGGRVAIDDFGTGFSSFSYLHSFPLDKLKIDGSFIDLLEASNIDNQAQTIVNSIVQLGKALNLQVTAEVIET